ncbi:MAG: hypothetical protein LQ344_007208 [Seirophora lacunosa]|nr:MAG: hypothetical protein LQ344_007208 [Seirophora lacunosa]
MWEIPSDNPDGRAFAAILIFFLAVAATCCLLRVYSRRLHRHALDASDYMCFLALLLDIGLTVIIWGAFAHGYGQDISQFSLDDARFSARIYIAINTLWVGAAVSVRIAIVLLCVRIFPIRQFRWASWFVIALNLATFLSIFLATFLICSPIYYAFDRTIPNGRCGDLTKFELYTACMSLLLDFLLVILPLPMLWRLQMKKKKKVQLSIVFGTGIIIVLLTLLRIFLSRFDHPENATKAQAVTALITGLEPTLGIINACLPFMPLVFQHMASTKFMQRLSTSLSRSSHKSGGAAGGGHPGAGDGTSGSDPVALKKAAYKGLSDIEMMHPATHHRDTHFVSSVVATGGKRGGGGGDEERGWEDDQSRDRIWMHKDYSITSEPQRSEGSISV